MSHPTFIDLFAGCGELSPGLLSSVRERILAVEKAPGAFRTFLHNLLQERIIERPRQQPVCRHWPDEIEVRAWGIDSLVGTHALHLQELHGNVAPGEVLMKIHTGV